MHLSLEMESVRPKKGKRGKKEKRHGSPQRIGVFHFKLKNRYQQLLGEELELVEGDKIIKTDADENKRRRTIIINKQNDRWGFTLQSYGIRHRGENELDHVTYVDYVENGGPAFLAGMRAGDVILSINGTDMEICGHAGIVAYIRSCKDMMRMVVLFEDCVKKIELHLRYLKLQRILTEKIFELRSLEQHENTILDANFNRNVWRRQSLTSLSSLDSTWDDRLSLLPELDRCPTPLSDYSDISHSSSSESTHVESSQRFIPRSLSVSASIERFNQWKNESFRSENVTFRQSQRRPHNLRLGGSSHSWSDFSDLKSRQQIPELGPLSADSLMTTSKLSNSAHFYYRSLKSLNQKHPNSNRRSDPTSPLSTSWSHRSLRDEILHNSFERKHLIFNSTSTPILEVVSPTVVDKDDASNCSDYSGSNADDIGISMEVISLGENSITDTSSGYISYSDIPTIELQLINEKDEDTHL